jgi:UDP-2,3-diacylglucosamine pyrophosphatase LpxH
VSKVRSLFLSDLHLGTPDCHADALLRYLDGIEADNIFLIGDVLDLTSLRRRACWPARHGEVLALLCRRAHAGVRVVYLPGNHDAALRDLVGLLGGSIELHAELLHTSASGLRLLLVHGDCFESRVHCSRTLAWLGSLAYDATLALTRWLNRLRRALGRPEWALVSAVKSRLPVAVRYVVDYEAAAVAAARRAGADGVVCGHIHVARLAVHDGIVYANTGDWVESCSALIEEYDGSLKLWRGTVAAEALSYDRHAAPAVTGA